MWKFVETFESKTTESYVINSTSLSRLFNYRQNMRSGKQKIYYNLVHASRFGGHTRVIKFYEIQNRVINRQEAIYLAEGTSSILFYKEFWVEFEIQYGWTAQSELSWTAARLRLLGVTCLIATWFASVIRSSTPVAIHTSITDKTSSTAYRLASPRWVVLTDGRGTINWNTSFKATKFGLTVGAFIWRALWTLSK